MQLAGLLGYGFSSRSAEGLAVAPEPQSFQEAKAQLTASEHLVNHKKTQDKDKVQKLEAAARKQEKDRGKDVRWKDISITLL